MTRQPIFALLALCALLTTACSKEESSPAGGKGVVEMRISTTRADAADGYDPLQHLIVRLFEQRDGGEVQLRQYTQATCPERLELLAGAYRVEVEAGERVPASTTVQYYVGETVFTLAAGETARAEVVCKRRHVTAEVQFAPSVATAFGDRFHVWVVADGAFDAGKAESGAVPALRFTADAAGYFNLPEGVTSLIAHFEGTHVDRGAIVKETRFDEVVPGGKYRFAYRFSKDLPGFVECFAIRIDETADQRDDTIEFSPEPTVEADGFELDQPQEVYGQIAPRTYRIAARADLSRLTVRIAGQEFDALAATTPGIEVVRDNAASATLTFTADFLGGLPGGEHTLEIEAADIKGAATSTATPFRIQGLMAVGERDCDLWANRLTLRALILDPAAGGVTFALNAGEAWRERSGTDEGNGLFSATFEAEWNESANEAGLKVYSPVGGVFAGHDYRLRAATDGGTTYESTLRTAAGQIIPGGDMEGSPSCFTTNNATVTTWGSGNNSMKKTLCTAGTREGMGGSQCAKLAASKTLGILAAGNLFFGTFTFKLPTGTVGFGQKYDFTARPRAMRVKYHATVGTVDVNKYNGPIPVGQPDRSSIFVSIVDWSARRNVLSGLSTPTGMWSPDAQVDLEGSGPILAYGMLSIDRSTEGEEMTTAEIPLLFYDKDAAAPAGDYTLVISCSTSAYGDYINGCSTNVLYVDDFEWVY